jgi:hypothetical protein
MLEKDNIKILNLYRLKFSLVILIFIMVAFSCSLNQVRAADDDYLRKYFIKVSSGDKNKENKNVNSINGDDYIDFNKMDYNQSIQQRLNPEALKLILLLKYLNSKNNNAKRPNCHLGLGMGYLCHAYSITKLSQHQKSMANPKAPGRR